MKNSGKIFLIFLVVLTLLALIDAKKKRGWQAQRKLRRYCRRSVNASENSALELHAFFDFTPKKQAFACLKITTCGGKPVCFVTSYSNIKRHAKNDSATWWRLMSYIQKDRKIEPIYDSSLNGWNSDKYKVLSKYIQNQPAMYRMCLDATIYRFVQNRSDKSNYKNSNNSNSSYKKSSTPHVKRAVNSSMPQSSANHSRHTPASSSNLDPIALCPVFAKTKNREGPRHTLLPFLVCHGTDCPCIRICVGQGRNRTNFHDCSTFRIICTFNCSPDQKPKNDASQISLDGKSKTKSKSRRKSGRARKGRAQKKNGKSKKQRRNKGRKWQLGIGK